jgi:signal transduction histidine kinase/ligand-binding sensor domain-containing protein
MKKTFTLLSVPAIVLLGFASCRNANMDTAAPPPTNLSAPVVTHFKFSKPQKINPDSLQTVVIKPEVIKFNFDKLKESPVDSSGFKPFSKPVEEMHLDIDALPAKPLDIGKLPTSPLKFKTYQLPPPKPLPVHLPRLKKAADIFVYGLDAPAIQGKPSTCIMRDHNGLMWIANITGIFRYDGERMTQFLNSDNISSAPVCMVEDRQGRIWVSFFNEDALAVLDPAAGTLKKTNLVKPPNSFERLFIDSKQRIWLSNQHSDGISIVDPTASTIAHLTSKNGLADTVAFVYVTDKSSRIWVTTPKGINIIDLEKKNIKLLNHAHGLGPDFAVQLFNDRAGRMWLSIHGGGSGLKVYDPAKSTLTTVDDADFPGNAISAINQDDDGNIWVGSFSDKQLIINYEARKIRPVSTADGLEGAVCYSLQPVGHQVWLSNGGGVNVIGGEKLKRQIGRMNTPTIFEDGRGLVWQGTLLYGIRILDLKRNTSRELTFKQGLTNDTIQTIKDFGGKIAVCTTSGLDIIDTAKHVMLHLTHRLGLYNKNITGVVRDKSGKIWLAGFTDGVDVYDPVTGNDKHFDKKAGLSSLIISDIKIDQEGYIWLATSTGNIDYIDPVNYTIRHLNSIRAFTESSFKVLFPDTHGNMWIGTASGLFAVNVKNGTLTAFTSAQGLPGNNVVSVLNRGNDIYAGTKKGISVISPPAGAYPWRIHTIGPADGIMERSTGNFLSDVILRNGLYLSGDNGITVLDLKPENAVQVSLYVAGLRIMDKQKYFIDKSSSAVHYTDTSWHTDAGLTGGVDPKQSDYEMQGSLQWDKVAGPANMPVNLRIPYDENFVQFQFSSVNLARRDSSWYRYRLLGAGDQWSDATPENASRYYVNLKPGRYVFEVSGQNRDLSWSKPQHFNFTILPPWWQTWWARLLELASLVAGVWTIVHYRSRRLLRAKRLLEEKVRQRTMEVTEQKEEIAAQRDDLENTLEELKNTQTQLVQREKMASLGELTAGIAHEIQNPLNFVNNFSEINREMLTELKDELKNGNVEEAMAIADNVQQNEEKINHHGKRADSIVKGMLQHSKASSGDKEATNINALADEYFRLAYHGLRAKDKSFNAELTTHFDKNLPQINVVPQDIGRVLLNLFNNAFYAVHQKQKTTDANYKPEVTVTTFTENGQVIIKVKDNGIGIPEAIKDKIMQPFFTTKPTGEGTGLGLSLSYDVVVKGHGGSITVNSKKEEGSEFTITLSLS